MGLESNSNGGAASFVYYPPLEQTYDSRLDFGLMRGTTSSLRETPGLGTSLVRR